MASLLDWRSNAEDFEYAPKDAILARYERAPLLAGSSTRTRRLSDCIVCKKITFDGEREYKNQLFAWKTLRSRALQIPQPIRYFESDDGTGRLSGYLVMEFVNGTPVDQALGRVDAKTVVQAIRSLHQQPLDVARDRPGSFAGGRAEGFPWGQDGAIEFGTLHGLEVAVNARLERYACMERIAPSDYTMGLEGQELVPCHMDLALRNILLLEDNTIAIVDWMTLALYPRVFETASLYFLAKTAPKDQKDLQEDIYRLANDTDDERDVKMLNVVHSMSTQYCFDL